MKKLSVLLVGLMFAFTSCSPETIEESQPTDCSKVNAHYEALTKGLSIEEASMHIEDWMEALDESDCVYNN
jgi:hypothetical protein